MVNATDSNETNETNETNDSQPEVASGEARLPLQLGRLPADHLERVHQAMEELQAAGLSELSDISALAKEVKSGSAEGNARLPSEHHTSEYMGMSLWSWTPKRWSESIENSGEPAGAKSGDLQTDEVELPVVPEKTLQSSAWRGERCQEFKTWFDSMMKADAEIRSMASMDTSVKHSGDGPGVLFAKTAKIEGFGTLPRFKSKEAAIMMDFRGGQMPTSKRPSLPIGAKPNTAPAIVSIHLDDDVGVDYWQYVMKEHYLKPSGKAEQEFYGCSDVMFSCSKSGRYVPRAILAGSPTRMDVASQASIFDPTSIVNSPEYSMAEGATGAELPELMEALRMQMERSDFCEGVVISQTIGKDYRSSALLQCILLNIMQDMPKMFKVTCACIPDVQADPDRAAANAGLCTRHLLESDLVAYYDATSLKNMASAKVTSPSDADCRGLAVRFLSGLTGPMRFGRFANSTPTRLACYGQSLMPYPRMKYTFPLIGHGPGSGLEVAATAIACGSLCTANDRSAGKTIAATMLCRGMEQSMALAAAIPRRVSHAEHWVDYAKGGFTIHSYQDPKCPEPQVTILENTGRAKTVIEHQLKGLDLESQSCDCAEIIEDLTALAADFDEVTAETVEDEGDEDEEEVE